MHVCISRYFQWELRNEVDEAGLGCDGSLRFLRPNDTALRGVQRALQFSPQVPKIMEKSSLQYPSPVLEVKAEVNVVSVHASDSHSHAPVDNHDPLGGAIFRVTGSIRSLYLTI